MCGIFGYVGTNKIALKEATDIIQHRGPDADGFLSYFPKENKLFFNASDNASDNQLRLNLGFRRLAIIDLKKHANQPFSDSSKKYHIIFNGEIYNYIEVRKELEKEGFHFKTQSDTEVLLKAYIHWGKECLQYLNGMWAFAILDLKRQKLFCSRDRFGIKPFFYSFTPSNGLFFASEIKQLLVAGVKKEFNSKLLKDYLDLAILDHTAETWYKNIFHLPAAHYLELDLNTPTKFSIQRYWQLKPQSHYENINWEEAKASFKKLFYDSVKLRFRSDVPVGSCLSGGLDSSSIVATASDSFDFPIHTFTLSSDYKQFDESHYVKELTKKYNNINPSFCQLDETAFKNQFDKVLFHQDEPFSSMSILAQWEVMRLAKENGVTVLLDGQGGDEQLAGYRKFYAFYLKEKLQKGQLVQFAREAAFLFKNREFNFFDKDGLKRYLNLSQNTFQIYSDLGQKLQRQSQIGLSGAQTLRERSKMDIEQYSFPPLLRYEDRNSMAFSLETRVPFMDYRLVEFLYSIPSDFKIKRGYTKAILRDSLKGVLPDSIRLRIAKLGFSTPQEIWMRKHLKPYFIKYFEQMNNPYLNNQNILVNYQNIGKNTSISPFLFFRIFCFDRWFQTHFNA